MQNNLSDQLIQRAVSLFPNSLELDQELEAIEFDPLISIYPDDLRFIQLINKIVITDFFGLRMLLRRLKLKNPEKQGLLKHFIEVQAHQKDCNFERLLAALAETKKAFPVWEQLTAKLQPNVQTYILNRLASMFASYDINELAKILNKNPKDTQEIVLLHGYKIQDNWVKFQAVHQRRTKNQEKGLIKNKQLELTELTTILSNFK